MTSETDDLQAEGGNANGEAVWHLTVEGPEGAGEQAAEIAVDLLRFIRGFYPDLLLATAFVSRP